MRAGRSVAAVLTTVVALAVFGGVGCRKSEHDGAPRHDVFIEVYWCSLPPPPPPVIAGADRSGETVFAFRVDSGKAHDVRRVSRGSVLDPEEATVRSCLDRWEFRGWPAGQEGQVRFKYTDLRGWEQLTVAVADYTVTVHQ